MARTRKTEMQEKLASHFDDINKIVRDRIAKGQLNPSEVDNIFKYLLAKIDLPGGPSSQSNIISDAHIGDASEARS